MDSYPVDLEPEQVVRWLLAEQAAGSLQLRLNAQRSAEIHEIPARPELHLGDEEREDLSELATIATLEVAPLRASDGWRLIIVVEDEGPRVLESRFGTEQSIDLNTFYRAFLRPGRGTASLTAEVEGRDGKARLSGFLRAIETNAHPDARRANG
jgi:hypothetical protein